MARRQFLGTASGSFVMAAAGRASGAARASVAQAAAPHELPKLPYADNALDPVISANTIGFHYGKHHQAYVTNLNNLLKDAPDLAALTLEALAKTTAGDPNRVGIFNNGAQVWNHTFYWNSMKPGGGGQPGGKLKDRIDADLGGYDKFKSAFHAAALGQFGSGWAWLIEDGGKLAIARTGNAETPMAQGKKCLLTIDVWEHAYYLDYQNRRADYITAWLDKLVNWEFAAKNLG
ncbi:MAG: superoxide dismutase [Alphaproteobacteria bacterium]|nr:superoxide dismutase [Alphaproteobacteria bacterium]